MFAVKFDQEGKPVAFSEADTAPDGFMAVCDFDYRRLRSGSAYLSENGIVLIEATAVAEPAPAPQPQVVSVDQLAADLAAQVAVNLQLQARIADLEAQLVAAFAP